jgi:hypothetical protein
MFGVLLEDLQARAGQQPVAWGFASDDGTFVLTGVPPGRYRFRLQFAPGARTLTGWSLRSASVEGRDILDEPVVVEPERDVNTVTVRYTDRGAELSGRLLDTTGAPAPEFVVVAFSADRKHWTDGSRRSTSFRPARDGSFSWIGVPPGEYYLGAVTRLETGQLGDAAFLESLIPTSARIVIAEGEKKRQDLRIGGR